MGLVCIGHESLLSYSNRHDPNHRPRRSVKEDLSDPTALDKEEAPTHIRLAGHCKNSIPIRRP